MALGNGEQELADLVAVPVVVHPDGEVGADGAGEIVAHRLPHAPIAPGEVAAWVLQNQNPGLR